MTLKGFTIYDNDSYKKLLDQVATEGKEPLIRCFEPVIARRDLATLDECEMALAASDLIASLNGRSSGKMPDDLVQQIKNLGLNLNINDQVLNIAADIIDILGSDSELKDLWKETEHYDEWTNHLIDIQNRLLN